MKLKNINKYLILLFFCGISYSQNIIKGIIINEKNLPIAGATINLIGSKEVGTVSNSDGTFTIITLRKFPISLSVKSKDYKEAKVDIEYQIKLRIRLENY